LLSPQEKEETALFFDEKAARVLILLSWLHARRLLGLCGSPGVAQCGLSSDQMRSLVWWDYTTLPATIGRSRVHPLNYFWLSIPPSVFFSFQDPSLPAVSMVYQWTDLVITVGFAIRLASCL
jgi:hypothetical protein